MFFSCSDEVTNPQQSDDLSLSKGRKLMVPKAPVELTAEEIEGLIETRQEEKVARDVYTVLYATWSEDFLAKIMASEQKHMDAVKNLLDYYEIDDPITDDAIGEFPEQKFTDMYNELVTLGTNSKEEAMLAGIAIEESSIGLLEDQLVIATAKNLIRVYTHLLRGSQRHLVAFQKHL
jgi:hypothetical protein